MTIHEKYRSPTYRADRVAKRYVRLLRVDGDLTYRVFECAARKVPKNRDRALSQIGAGPTIREYDTRAGDLPAHVVEAANAADHNMIEWVDR